MPRAKAQEADIFGILPDAKNAKLGELGITLNKWASVIKIV
jgi:hypothetical protein